MKRLALAAMLCSLALGCSDVRPDAGETIIESPELTPEIARAALVAMFSEQNDNSMDFYDVEKWRNAPLKSPKDGWLPIGPLGVDLIKRTYSYQVSRPEPGGRGFFMESEGEFKIQKNKWIATPMRVKSIS